MQVTTSPRRLEALAGVPQPISVTITNTGDLIAGYTVRVLGADPAWVSVDDDDISLFPDETRTVVALVTVPAGINAGERRLAVQVRELTPPEASTIDDVVLDVPPAPATTMRVDPLAVTAGRTARFSLLVENTGNTTVHGQVIGQDPEGKVRFRFQPAVVDLAPGEHGVVDVRATARQSFLGAPTLRVLTLGVGEPVAAPPAPVAAPVPVTVGAPAGPVETGEGDVVPLQPAAPSLAPPRRRRRGVAPEQIAEGTPVTYATFVQRAVLSRGPLSLLGLLVAVTVFALVITLALSRLVGQSAADRNLALEIASARDDAAAGAGAGSSVGGTVRLLTSGAAVPSVAVGVYTADDTAAPVATTATAADGTWRVGDLPAGDYKVTFRGAGFVQLWYPQSIDASNAETVTLEPGAQQAALDVALGGVPATLTGRVVGDDVSTATLTLRTPAGTVSAAGAAPGTTAAADDQGAQVASVPIGSDGTFTLTNVPSPSVYDLVVTKQGFATSTQRVDIAAGEERSGIEITLREGDGVVSGTVGSADGPLGGVMITATAGGTTVTTMSLTEGDVGAFTLRGLPTPASFTLTATAPDYATQVLTVSLSDGQRLTGVGLTLGRASGSLGGKVTLAPSGNPAAGVVVTVTDGAQVVRTATQSAGSGAGGLGSWSVTGLQVPGTYTVTFSRSDLSPQTLSVVLDSSGNLASGGSSDSPGSVDTTMQPSTATLTGVVTQRGTGGGASPTGEVTITLTSGTSTYTTTTASVPATATGRYRLENIPPGTYTFSTSRSGVTPTSTIIELGAGDVRDYPVQLAASASIRGTVVRPDGTSVAAGYVVELYRADDYPDDLYLSTTTAADGSFSFPDVDAPEAYVLQVRRTRGSAPSGTRTVQVSSSQALQTTITTTS